MREKLIEQIKKIVPHIRVWEHATPEEADNMIAEQLADGLIMCGVTLGKDTDVPTKWISVEERLPEHRQEVLCYCRCGMHDALYFDYEEWAWMRKGSAREAYMKGFVTHWMPLPEPPSGE